MVTLALRADGVLRVSRHEIRRRHRRHLPQRRSRRSRARRAARSIWASRSSSTTSCSVCLIAGVPVPRGAARRAASAACWRASRATNSGCAPSASRRFPTSWPRSRWPVRSPASPDFLVAVEGWLRQSGNAVVARVGRRAADADPGRHGRLSGAVLGAFAFALLQLFFQWSVVFGNFAKHWQLHARSARSSFALRSCRNGLIGFAGAVWRRARGARKAMPEEPLAGTTGAPLLRARGVTRRFGGLAAVSGGVARPRRGRDSCGDRHQRRRQVDADQRACG